MTWPLRRRLLGKREPTANTDSISGETLKANGFALTSRFFSVTRPLFHCARTQNTRERLEPLGSMEAIRALPRFRSAQAPPFEGEKTAYDERVTMRKNN